MVPDPLKGGRVQKPPEGVRGIDKDFGIRSVAETADEFRAREADAAPFAGVADPPDSAVRFDLEVKGQLISAGPVHLGSRVRPRKGFPAVSGIAREIDQGIVSVHTHREV